MERKLFHPLIVGFILSVLVLLIFSRYFPKYYIDILQEANLSNKSEMYYFDLDFDGNSEKLHYCHYDKVFQPTLYLYNSDGNFVSLWNFFESPIKNCEIFAGDYNNDKIKEIFVFTEKSDSIFLYVLNSQNDKELVVNRECIACIPHYGKNLKIKPIGLFKLNPGKNKELLFSVDAGSPLLPRKLYSFNISQKELKASPEIFAEIINPIIVEDINSDGNIEILVSNQSNDAIGNGNQVQLLVLDNNLNNLFSPINFYGSLSRITMNTLQTEEGKQIAVLNSGLQDDNVFNNLMLYDIRGKRILEKTILANSNLVLTSIKDNNEGLFLFSGKKLMKYNSKLELTRKYTVSNNEKADFILSANFNKDSLNEYLFIGEHKMVILSSNLKNRTIHELSGVGKINATVSTLKYIPNKLSIQIGSSWYMLKYLKNKKFMNSQLFIISILLILIIVSFWIFRLKSKKYKRNLLSRKGNLIIDELEDNIDEKVSGLKNKLENYKNELNDDSFKKVIDDIDDTFNEVKTISKKILADKTEKFIIEENFSEMINFKDTGLKLTVNSFPEDSWSSINKNMKKKIIELADGTIAFISNKYKGSVANIQLVSHTDYINLLIEVESVFIRKDDFTLETNVETVLGTVNGKYEIENISNFGTIIDMRIQEFEKLEDSSSSNKIKVIIAEDHDVSLFGLLSLFKTRVDIDVVGTAKNGMEVLKILETKKTDIVITDISMPGMDGIELSEKLQKDYPDIKVIVFTMYLENWFIEQLANNGVKGFVSKNSKIIELIGALHRVNEGNNYYCPQFKSKFGLKGNGYGSTQKLDSLTKNELQIVKYYAEGLSKGQIAEEMLVSTKIIETFLSNILIKLNAGDEDEIIYMAKKQKLISD